MPAADGVRLPVLHLVSQLIARAAAIGAGRPGSAGTCSFRAICVKRPSRLWRFARGGWPTAGGRALRSIPRRRDITIAVHHLVRARRGPGRRDGRCRRDRAAPPLVGCFAVFRRALGSQAFARLPPSHFAYCARAARRARTCRRRLALHLDWPARRTCLVSHGKAPRSRRLRELRRAARDGVITGSAQAHVRVVGAVGSFAFTHLSRGRAAPSRQHSPGVPRGSCACARTDPRARLAFRAARADRSRGAGVAVRRRPRGRARAARAARKASRARGSVRAQAQLPRAYFLQMLRLGAARPRDERCMRPIPPLDHTDVHLGGTGDDAVERGARHLAEPATARALPCETRHVVAPAASRIQSEPAAAGASSTSSASASSAATEGEAGRTLGCRALSGRPNAADSGGSPISSAAAVTAARASPGSSRRSTATVTIASPRKSSAAPCPQPSASRRARTSQTRSASRRSRGRSAVPVDPGLPAPIAAARAISSEASVALAGTTPPSAAVSTVSTVPLSVQSTG